MYTFWKHQRAPKGFNSQWYLGEKIISTLYLSAKSFNLHLFLKAACSPTLFRKSSNFNFSFSLINPNSRPIGKIFFLLTGTAQAYFEKTSIIVKI
jgi:hypothetical protein